MSDRNLRPILIVAILVFSMFTGSYGRSVTYTEADSGKTVQLKVGNSIIIVLDGNLTTGYSWGIAPNLPSIVKLTKEPEFSTSSELIGAGGKYTFQFTAVKPGKDVIKLVYRRIWEKIKPIKTCYIKITVID
jgi:inhibitor of cysteine peptidase